MLEFLRCSVKTIILYYFIMIVKKSLKLETRIQDGISLVQSPHFILLHWLEENSYLGHLNTRRAINAEFLMSNQCITLTL